MGTLKGYWLTSIVLCICFMFLLPGGLSQAAETKNENQQRKVKPFEITVVLERVYLDGECSQEIFKETIYSMEDFWGKYASWEFIDMKAKKAVFRKQIDDISPLLKANGYFGISGEGILSIYNGKPDESNVIQSFFQIDLGKLESTKRLELREGIPVKNKDRYVEVLETFKNYSVKDEQAN